MATFKITLCTGPAGHWPVIVDWAAQDTSRKVRRSGILELDLRALKEVQDTAYGDVLGKALFHDDVLVTFTAALTQARADRDGPLHVLLAVEAEDLEVLRWERLCAPLGRKEWKPMALDQRVPLSFHLPTWADRRFPALRRRDLKALILATNPADPENRWRLPPFDVGEAVSVVLRSLGKIPCDVLADTDGSKGPPTLDALCDRLTAEQYPILHVVCHGAYVPEKKESLLFLSDPEGRVAPVTAADLLDRLESLGETRGVPYFAFLSCCNVANPAAAEAAGGLAQRLVRDVGVPAVLAMTAPIGVGAAFHLASAFYRQLGLHGEVDLALAESCAGLANHVNIAVPVVALFSHLEGRPLFSDTHGELNLNDVAFGLDRLEQLLPARAPVLCPELEALLSRLRAQLNLEDSELPEAALNERKKALARVNEVCGEVLDVSFRALASGKDPGPGPADGDSPFRGLYPFRLEHRRFFFGREPMTKSLVERMNGSNFLAVVGQSGSGKSSLVLAGLVPRLLDVVPDRANLEMTPGDDPLGRLEYLLSPTEGRNRLLVVDQFEELFTLCRKESDRREFLDRLLGLPRTTLVVVTMRADFWGEVARYPALKDRMLAEQELIAPMDEKELRAAIEEQAKTAGLRFEADLSNTILDDVQGEPGAMPLLQHALLELWKRRHGRWLRADAYRATGGVKKAIAETAEAVFRDLPYQDQENVRDIFLRLTRLDEDTVRAEEKCDTPNVNPRGKLERKDVGALDEERRDTRQRVPLDELTPAGSDRADESPGQAHGRCLSHCDQQGSGNRSRRGRGGARSADPLLAAIAQLAKRRSDRLAVPFGNPKGGTRMA